MIDRATTFDIREIGFVKSLRKFIVVAGGLPSCMNGQIVEFASGLKGLVMGFTEDEVQILLLGSAVDIRSGDEVYNRGKPLTLPVGDAFLGRVVDSLCEPQDNLGEIKEKEFY